MNIHDAIMKAATHIELFPEQFDFRYGIVPGSSAHSCGMPSCALGWIGAFANTKSSIYTEVCEELFGFDRWKFYSRLNQLMGGDDKYGMLDSWSRNSSDCAKALRLYAAKYHAPSKAVTPPDWNAIAASQTIGEHERSQELA